MQVCSSPDHSLRKLTREVIHLLAGHGVEGDAHAGPTVKHRSRVRVDPAQPNLRQVHLIHSELHDDLAAKGMPVGPGEMGENITTRGIDLLSLPRDTVLRIGSEAQLRVTGLRNPCRQLNTIHPGLMKATLDRTSDGQVVRKAGVMAVVVVTGIVKVGDAIVPEFPDGRPLPLERV